MLHSGRRPPSTEFGPPGRGSNHIMPLFISTPVPGSMIRDPKPDMMVCVKDTTLPSASATQR